jgi:hypothetical protein
MPKPGDALHDFGNGFAAIAGDHPAGYHLCQRGAQRRDNARDAVIGAGRGRMLPYRAANTA